jgi:hypothetical protein
MRKAPRLIEGGDISFEELRWEYYQAAQAGQVDQLNAVVAQRQQEMDQKWQRFLQDPASAIRAKWNEMQNGGHGGDGDGMGDSNDTRPTNQATIDDLFGGGGSGGGGDAANNNAGGGASQWTLNGGANNNGNNTNNAMNSPQQQQQQQQFVQRLFHPIIPRIIHRLTHFFVHFGAEVAGEVISNKEVVWEEEEDSTMLGMASTT